MKEELIVSLTSYPKRISIVNQTIETLLSQSLKADKVILWLSDVEFPNKEDDLPPQLLKLKENGLEIDWCNNIKSYQKLIPALKKYPNSVIVTADDDILYPPDWLKKLVSAYEKNPEFIHAQRGHYVTFNIFKKIIPYAKWHYEIQEVKPSFNNFATGVGGVLYPPKCLYKDILREDIFINAAPNADDIWFWAMAVMAGTKINIIEDNIPHLEAVPVLVGNKDALVTKNVANGGNDVQLEKVLALYPEILKKLDTKQVKIKTAFNLEYKFLERIFSIKNSKNSVYKIITFLGIKILIKRK